MEDKVIKPRFVKGQKVIIKPVSESGLSQRENDISQYAGQVGEVSDYYWMTPPAGKMFYIYKVLVGDKKKEIVVYEDEMEPCLI